MTRNSDEEFISSDDSDAELQELFAKGLLGQFSAATEEKPKTFVNNLARLKEKLEEIKTDFNWVERLDIVSDPAPMAPEMALQLQEKEDRAQLVGGGLAAKGQLDEFKRESLFHRQAQAAVLEGLSRLKSLGVPVKRPDDYFAEMAKSDQHMQKVRAMLVKRQAEKERSEKVRSIRQKRKFNKQMQAEMKVKKQNEKKVMLDEVKKFRKGVRKDLNFLEDSKSNLSQRNNEKSHKQAYKDKKFGFGGKKRGMKRNTKESTSDFGSGGGLKRNFGNKKQKANKRPGKNVRQKMKSRKRN